jgi:hypothetical protein
MLFHHFAQGLAGIRLTTFCGGINIAVAFATALKNALGDQALKHRADSGICESTMQRFDNVLSRNLAMLENDFGNLRLPWRQWLPLEKKTIRVFLQDPIACFAR